MKRGSQIALAVSTTFLLAAGVTNMCSAVAREEPARTMAASTGKFIPVVMQDGVWLRENREFMPRMRRRMKGHGKAVGDLSAFRDEAPRVVPASAVFSLPPNGARVRRGLVPQVSLSATNMPVAAALQQIFVQAKVPYAIDPRVSGRVTYHGDDVPFYLALRQVLCRAAPALSFHVRDGIYTVLPRGVDSDAGFGGIDLVAFGD